MIMFNNVHMKYSMIEYLVLNHPTEWTARSPDLTPRDFFLWSFLKSGVFTSLPQSIEILRQRIIAQVNFLRNSLNFILNSFRSIERRVNVCLEREGLHARGHQWL